MEVNIFLLNLIIASVPGIKYCLWLIVACKHSSHKPDCIHRVLITQRAAWESSQVVKHAEDQVYLWLLLAKMFYSQGKFWDCFILWLV